MIDSTGLQRGSFEYFFLETKMILEILASCFMLWFLTLSYFLILEAQAIVTSTTVLPEDPSWDPTTHARELTAACNSSLCGYEAFLCPTPAETHMSHRLIQTHTYQESIFFNLRETGIKCIAFVIFCSLIELYLARGVSRSTVYAVDSHRAVFLEMLLFCYCRATARFL